MVFAIRAILILVLFSCSHIQEQRASTVSNPSQKDICKNSGVGLSDQDNPLVVLVAPNKLVLENVTISEVQPFPSIPLKYLKLSAKINDVYGFGKFTIQSLNRSSESAKEESVVSEIERLVVDLPAGSYSIRVVPCNSLGCNEKASIQGGYQQGANPQNSVATTLLSCVDAQKQLRATGADIVASAGSMQKVFSIPELNLTSPTGCAQQKDWQNSQNVVENIQKLGKEYIGEAITNVDGINQLRSSVIETTSDGTQTQSNTSTKNSASSSTPSNLASSAQKIFFSLGISSMAAGIITAMMYYQRSVPWEVLIGGQQGAVVEVEVKLLEQTNNTEVAQQILKKSTELPEDLRKAVAEHLQEPHIIKKFQTSGKASQNMEDITLTEKERINWDIVDKQRLASKKAFRNVRYILAGALAAGVTMVTLSQTVFNLTDGSHDPLQSGGQVISEKVLPLQQTFEACALDLRKKVNLSQ